MTPPPPIAMISSNYQALFGFLLLTCDSTEDTAVLHSIAETRSSTSMKLDYFLL